MTSLSSSNNSNSADWTADKRPWCQPWTWIHALLTGVSMTLCIQMAAQKTAARIVTARTLHRAWWLTQRNTLCELWCACPWPGNTSLQHNPSERFDALISRDCPQSRLRRDLGTSNYRRVEWLPPATALKYIFEVDHISLHTYVLHWQRGGGAVSQRLLWNDVHGVVRPSDVFPVNLILLLKAMVKTRKTRTVSFAALWRELEDVAVCPA